MAVQGQAGFQTQAVAGAQTNWFDAAVAEQFTDDSFGGGSGNRDLETVFAGIAGARGQAIGVGEVEKLCVHEFHLGRVRIESAEDVAGFRPLQRDQRRIDPFKIQLRTQRRQTREIGITIAGIDHDGH